MCKAYLRELMLATCLGHREDQSGLGGLTRLTDWVMGLDRSEIGELNYPADTGRHWLDNNWFWEWWHRALFHTLAPNILLYRIYISAYVPWPTACKRIYESWRGENQRHHRDGRENKLYIPHIIWRFEIMFVPAQAGSQTLRGHLWLLLVVGEWQSRVESGDNQRYEEHGSEARELI